MKAEKSSGVDQVFFYFQPLDHKADTQQIKSNQNLFIVGIYIKHFTKHKLNHVGKG
jgi:hypothetical protein